MTKTKNAPEEMIAEIRRLLAAWLRTSPKAHRPVARILQLLDGLETALRGRMPSARRRGQAELLYSIERTQHGDMLVEERTGSTAQPFKVSRAVYNAVAEVVSDQPHPQPVATIAEQVASRVPVSTYHIRLCLRFWMTPEIALVSRTRARYQALKPAAFMKESARAWSSLATPNK